MHECTEHTVLDSDHQVCEDLERLTQFVCFLLATGEVVNIHWCVASLYPSLKYGGHKWVC